MQGICRTVSTLCSTSSTGIRCHSVIHSCRLEWKGSLFQASKSLSRIQNYQKESIHKTIQVTPLRHIWRTRKFFDPNNCVSNHNFSTSHRRDVPPIFWFFIKPVAKIGAALTGRGVRKWWKALSSSEKRFYQKHIKQNWPVFGVVGFGLIVLGFVYYESHLQEAPITGRKRFIIITHDQLMKIADAESQVYLEKHSQHLLPEDHAVFKTVASIAYQLITKNEELQHMSVKKWKLTLIDEDDINAFVTPNGHIFVYTGLVNFVQNQDQMAVVLGHEMAHALLSHGSEQLSFAQLLDFLIIAVMAAMWTIMPTDGIAIVTQWFYNKVIALMLHMPYSRKLEKEADKVGLHLAAKACYDIREGSVLWKRMDMSDSLSKIDKLPEWLSTHPAHKNRVDHLNHLVPEVLKLREGCNCSPLPKEDPRDYCNHLEQFVENHITAQKAGQNLQKVPVVKKTTK